MILPSEQRQAEVYFSLLERYRNLPLEQSLPILAVRWLCLTGTFDDVVSDLRTQGISATTLCSLREIARYSRFVETLVAKYPPPPESLPGVVEDGLKIRTVGDLPSTRDRIAAFLSRIMARENALHPVDPKKMN